MEERAPWESGCRACVQRCDSNHHSLHHHHPPMESHTLALHQAATMRRFEAGLISPLTTQFYQSAPLPLTATDHHIATHLLHCIHFFFPMPSHPLRPPNTRTAHCGCVPLAPARCTHWLGSYTAGTSLYSTSLTACSRAMCGESTTKSCNEWPRPSLGKQRHVQCASNPACKRRHLFEPLFVTMSTHCLGAKHFLMLDKSDVPLLECVCVCVCVCVCMKTRDPHASTYVAVVGLSHAPSCSQTRV